MNYLVYKITNQANGKIYIGVHKTANVDDGYMGSGKLIKAAIKKYGLENFKKEILAQFESADEMFNEEKNLISQLSPEYNLHPGGNGGWNYVNNKGLNRSTTFNQTLQEELKIQKKAWSDQQAKFRFVPGTRQREICMSGVQSMKKKYNETGMWSFSGKFHTDETKKIMSEKAKKRSSGQDNSQFGTKWITNGEDSKKITADQELEAGWRLGRTIKKQTNILLT